MSKIVYEIEPRDVSFHIFSRVPGLPHKSHGATGTLEEAISLAREAATRHPERYIYVEQRP